jgi:hypothetical protein
MHEKIKFADIPVGTYFTYVGTIKKVHYFKIEEVELWEGGYIDRANAVKIEEIELWEDVYVDSAKAVTTNGLMPGTLTAFCDDEEVYAGAI